MKTPTEAIELIRAVLSGPVQVPALERLFHALTGVYPSENEVKEMLGQSVRSGGYFPPPSLPRTS